MEGGGLMDIEKVTCEITVVTRNDGDIVFKVASRPRIDVPIVGLGSYLAQPINEFLGRMFAAKPEPSFADEPKMRGR